MIKAYTEKKISIDRVIRVTIKNYGIIGRFILIPVHGLYHDIAVFLYSIPVNDITPSRDPIVIHQLRTHEVEMPQKRLQRNQILQ